MRRQFITRLLFTFIMLIGNLFSVHNGYADEDNLEYKLKAAFILNFAKFTSWPSNSSDKKTFNIGIIGSDDFGDAFTRLETKKIDGRPVKLTLMTPNTSTNNCHVIFISKTNLSDARTIVHKFQQKPVLLISDIDEFAEAGGIIEFVMIKNRLSFIINNTAARRKGLEINSSLLSLAVKVF